ncbi:Acg family FMN-binding oxidoreductase [Neisseria weixii]|uniref:Acg family FMN-binding oxidoreductase n=1 Tax=Neisseria weixii TaxID=1853276 RepID=UPI0035A1BF7C
MSDNLYTKLITQATLAPSGHNTQPWRFGIQDDGTICITPDLRRALPIVDGDNRELFISLGCAAENLALAAGEQGYAAQVHSNETTGSIRIHLEKQAVEPDPLVAQIARRQTNRSLYSARRIPDDVVARLQQIPAEAGTHVCLYANGTPSYAEIGKYILQANTLQMRNPAFKQELKTWLRYNKKHQDQTRDGLSYAAFGAPNVPRWIAEIAMSLAMREIPQHKSCQRQINHASHFALFTLERQTVTHWINLGRTLQRFLLAATAHGLAHSYLNQPCEERTVAQNMAQALSLNTSPVILIRLGYAAPRPYSLRRNIADVIDQS